MLRSVTDLLGHEIYLTDEGWAHVCDEHPEMQAYEAKFWRRFSEGEGFKIRSVPMCSFIIAISKTCPPTIPRSLP
jgi:hypothetical protein